MAVAVPAAGRAAEGKLGRVPILLRPSYASTEQPGPERGPARRGRPAEIRVLGSACARIPDVAEQPADSVPAAGRQPGRQPVRRAGAIRGSAIHRVGTDLLRIINDFLDMARIQAGRLDVLPGPVPVGRLVEEAEATFRPAAEHKGLRLVTEVSAEVPAELYTDEHLIQQVLSNLLANAVKFTLGRSHRHPGERARARAGATPGLLRGQRHRHRDLAGTCTRLIFEPFRQADAGTTRAYGGTGLGLTICRGARRACSAQSASIAPRARAARSARLPLSALAACRERAARSSARSAPRRRPLAAEADRR